MCSRSAHASLDVEFDGELPTQADGEPVRAAPSAVRMPTRPLTVLGR